MGLGTMAKVVVRLYASLREAAGIGECAVDARDVRSVFAELTRMRGSRLASELKSVEADPETIVVLVNGRTVRQEGWSTRLEDGDEVAMFPPVSGG